KEWQIRMQFQMQKLVAEIIEFVCLSILRICVYLIFFIQKIWAYILIILGPIAVGMSLVPGFENSLYSWVSKFININLYTFVAYTVINIGVLMTPTIADTIVTAGGAGAMTKMKSAAGKLVSGVKAAVLAAKTGGTSAVAAAAKSGTAGSASGRVQQAMKNGK